MSSFEIEFYKNTSERFEEQYWQGVEAINNSLQDFWEIYFLLLLCIVLISFISSIIVLWLTYDK